VDLAKAVVCLEFVADDHGCSISVEDESSRLRGAHFAAIRFQ
jgi:hypothetical protein